ncbi:MAG: TIGR02757 family protein [Candidatus Aminicenantes bacterium]|nr:TIGR02757 family protein [Candidatus Aminicenantes bacterium]
MMKLSREELKNFLDEKADLYNRPAFIELDPISIPHHYTGKGDIEIAGFLAAIIAWGNRKMILKSSVRMMEILEDSPFEFIVNSSDCELDQATRFVHRTFNSVDLAYFLKALRHIYRNKGGLETIFETHKTSDSLQPAIHELHKIFFELPHEKRTERHISDPFKGSAAKRINLFLRWMVRKDNKGVDFGIWEKISPSILSCPLDVHSGNVARKLGLLKRTQNDAKAVSELDRVLRNFDPEDPVKYDFALFGLSVFEKF